MVGSIPLCPFGHLFILVAWRDSLSVSAHATSSSATIGHQATVQQSVNPIALWGRSPAGQRGVPDTVVTHS